jgi:hypothetical protein
VPETAKAAQPALVWQDFGKPFRRTRKNDRKPRWSDGFSEKDFGQAVRVNPVTAPGVSERLENCEPRNGTAGSGFGVSRQERRLSLRPSGRGAIRFSSSKVQ